MGADTEPSVDCQSASRRAETYLRGGLELLAWFSETRARDSFRLKAPLMYEAFEPSPDSFSFIDEAPDILGQRLPVVGMAMDILFDGQKAPRRFGELEVAWLKSQVRAYMMKYFLRYGPRLRAAAHSVSSSSIPTS